MNRNLKNKVVYAWLDGEEVFYVGIGSINRSKSKQSRNPHCKRKREKSEKAGNFSIQLLYTDLSFEEACKREIELIEQYGRLDLKTGCLTNMTNGGEFNDYWRGRTFKDSHKKSISKSCKGKSLSEDHKIKIGLSHKGKEISKETRRKISESNSIGEKWKKEGWKMKDEYKKKILPEIDGIYRLNTTPVCTPHGIFESYEIAALAFEMSGQQMYKKCKSKVNDSFYFTM